MNDDDVREALGVRPVCRRINKIIHIYKLNVAGVSTYLV